MTRPFHPQPGVGDHETSLTCVEVPDGIRRDAAGPGPACRAEIVHEGGRTRITRLFLPGRTVIRKEPLGPDAERRVRHEDAMLKRLRGAKGLAQLADDSRYPGCVVLADHGEEDLAGMTKPLPADDLAGLGLGLARAVAGMHQRGVIHRDITPANIVVSADGTPCLVDFALASSWPRSARSWHHAEIVGALCSAMTCSGRDARRSASSTWC